MLHKPWTGSLSNFLVLYLCSCSCQWVHCYTAVTFDVDDKRLPIKVIIISRYSQSFSKAHNLHWFMSNKFTCSPYVLFTLPSTSGTRFSALSYSLKLFKPIQSPKAITIAREKYQIELICKLQNWAQSRAQIFYRDRGNEILHYIFVTCPLQVT